MRSLMVTGFALAALVLPGDALAAVVFDHAGSVDPTTEGWVETLNAGVSVGPIVGDLGFNAWLVDDNGTAIGTSGAYSIDTSASQNTQAANNGWTLRTRLRVVDVPDASGGSVAVLYRNGTTSFQMHFGTQADGDPFVQLLKVAPATGPTFALEGGAGIGYHLYDSTSWCTTPRLRVQISSSTESRS